MERNAFARPANDWDAMPAMGDSDHEAEVFADSPRMARSMALLAKRRQVKGSANAKELKMRSERKVWEDITTDDEDTFPQWAPQVRVARTSPSLPATEEGSAVSEGLGWDPIGLGSTHSTVSELLWDKTQATKMDAGDGTIFDKWSWSTTATETAVPQEQAEDSPKSSQSSQEDSSGMSELAAGFERADQPTGLQLQRLPVETQSIGQMPMILQNQAEAAYPVMPQLPQMPQMQQMILPLMAPMASVAPVAPVAPVASVGVNPMAPLAPGPLVPGQLPMPVNLGMLPILMSMPQPPKPAEVLPQPRREIPSSGAIEGPPMGRAHRFHQKNSCMGVLSADARTFTKRYNKGRLSIICENKVHFHGSVRYAVQFTEGELCSADGVGFILSSDLPCTRNIQKIVSIFANRTGRICIRVHDEVVRCPQRVKCLEIGDWLEVKADLVNQTVSFTVWPQDSSDPSFATVSFKETFKEARGRVNGLPRSPCGFLAVVVKHLGVSVNLGS